MEYDNINIDDVIIRHINMQDIDGILNVENRCFGIPWSRESFEYEIEENEKARYVVAQYNGNIIGYVGLWKILDEGHITNVAVLKQFRKMGIATLMLNKLFKEAKEEGINSFTLEVGKTNAIAISLYEKFGFKISGLRKGYYKNTNDDALIMWKR